MDLKLVAKDETYHISSKFRIPIDTVRRAMKDASKTDKPCVSLARIYAELVKMNWMVVTVLKNGRKKYSQGAQADRPY